MGEREGGWVWYERESRKNGETEKREREERDKRGKGRM